MSADEHGAEGRDAPQAGQPSGQGSDVPEDPTAAVAPPTPDTATVEPATAPAREAVDVQTGDVVTINWGSSSAQAAIGGPRRTAKTLVDELGLSEPRPIVLVIGGADSLEPAVAGPLERLLERGVLQAAGGARATIVDGGTDSGVMALLGRASVASDTEIQLVGVAPCGKVGNVRSGKGDLTTLECNHSAFLLADGDDWDDAVSLLFDAVELMSRDQPVAVVVAGGGSNTADEVHVASHRAYPIVVISGTGGIADALATAKSGAKSAAAAGGAARADDAASDPDRLGEVVEETDLTVFPLHGDPVDLGALIDRLLRVDETLLEAWQQQRIVSVAATQQQRSYRLEQTTLLLLGVLLTFLVIATQVLTEAGLFKIEGGRYAPLGDFLRILILLIPIIVTTMAAASNRMRPGTRWVLLRGTSESLKAQIFRYRARAGLYSRAKTREYPREVKLAQAIGSQLGTLMRTDVNLLGLPDPKPEAPAGDDADDKLSRLTPRGYVTQRIEKQMVWYRNAAAQREREARRLRYIALAFGAMGTFLAAVGFQIWVAVTTALVGAFTTYLQVWQLDASIVLYNQAATDLASIRAWWLALPPSEQNDQANIDDLVERAERIMRAENVGWVQEMQDAMTHLRLEQGDDDSPQGIARRRSRAGSRTTDGRASRSGGGAASTNGSSAGGAAGAGGGASDGASSGGSADGTGGGQAGDTVGTGTGAGVGGSGDGSGGNP